jgi:hypothetical protein
VDSHGSVGDTCRHWQCRCIDLHAGGGLDQRSANRCGRWGLADGCSSAVGIPGGSKTTKKRRPRKQARSTQPSINTQTVRLPGSCLAPFRPPGISQAGSRTFISPSGPLTQNCPFYQMTKSPRNGNISLTRILLRLRMARTPMSMSRTRPVRMSMWKSPTAWIESTWQKKGR